MRQQTVDPREGCVQALSVMLAAAATQRCLAATQSRPQLLAIDQDAPIGHDLGKEGRLGRLGEVTGSTQ